MVKIIVNDFEVTTEKNWDSALRTVADLVKHDLINLSEVRIIGNRGDELPVTIKHLTIEA